MFVNLCEHDFNIRHNDRHIEVVEPSGLIARVHGKWETVGAADGIPIKRYIPTEVVDLPVKVPGITYLVSTAVARAVNKIRKDVVAPDTSDGSGAVKIDGGFIITTFNQYF